MNKKKLSVVMAGAMLATTAAPIMAATTTDTSTSNLGLLIGNVREKLMSEHFSNDQRNANVGGKDYRNQSVYYVKINGIENEAITTAATGNGSGLQNALQTALGNLTPGTTVEIWSRGFVVKGDGENKKVYATELQKNYTEADMVDNGTIATAIEALAKVNTNILVAGGSTVKDWLTVVPNQSVTIKLNEKSGVPGNQIVIKPGSPKLDFTKYINDQGNAETITGSEPTAANFKGFAVMTDAELEGNTANYTKVKDSLVETINIVGAAPNTFKTSELFNGVMLTTEGHDLLTKIENTAPPVVAGDHKTENTATGKAVFTTLEGDRVISVKDYTLPKSSDGTYGFNIALTDISGNTTNYVVKGDKKDTTTLLNWLLTQDPKVDILAGEDRYATAVKVAEQYIQNKPFSGKGNVVLVNGNSLVDGLSAAPLASKLEAPMLLSKTDEVPKATIDYLMKLSQNTTIANLKDITIHLVGGKSVLSNNVEKQLKALGYTVKRYGGEDREATSMKVAKAVVGSSDLSKAFIVGAKGEADAMSISSVASNKNKKVIPDAVSATVSSVGLDSGATVTPIIVSGFNGLSDNTLDALENAQNVAVVGGNAVVSDKEYDAIKEAMPTKANLIRIAGENRQETNAKVISTYYKNAFGNDTDVLVAKDGMGNKMELVDALTVSNLAAIKDAPVVLATNKLDKAQINALELNAKKAKTLFQVGHGVSLDVVKTLANLLGLN